MSVDKVLQKLQMQIADLINNLENFTDETVQPSFDECNLLQKQLCEIQEQLAIYKFQKTNKEISPSFNIHAKVSEVNPIVESKKEVEELIKKEEPVAKVEAQIPVEIKEVVMETIKPEIKPPIKTFTVGINDKFRFINELFLHNAAEYNIAVEQINNLNNWNDCELYLNSLKNLYSWKDQNDTVKLLFSVVKKRFE